MENTEALDFIQNKIDEQLEHAYKIQEGHQVFKSVDGTWAVDQNGRKLDPQKDDLDLIPQTAVTAEDFLQTNDELKRLQKERQEILDYQEKFDHAGDRADADDFSQDEFDGLKNSFNQFMPVEVRRKLPNYDPSQEIDLKTNFSESTKQFTKLNPNDMQISPDMTPVMG